jgi:hypothetical protein
MNTNKEKVLSILDQCAENFTFPVMDNGYVYLAATKLSVYRSNSDWAIVIEVFGFSPRSDEPEIQIYTFSSTLRNRNEVSNFVSKEAYDKYLINNPYNEFGFVYPIENSDWINEEESECLNENSVCILRGINVPLPELTEYTELGIELEGDSPLIFEFCRYLAGKYREKVLCSEEERRVNVLPEMKLILQLDDWHHPDISGGALPSSTKTFQQIAEVIETGDLKFIKNSGIKNTHWVNWPEAGRL